jgi:NMD protein affecting ribosome stability and mRNA decay
MGKKLQQRESLRTQKRGRLGGAYPYQRTEKYPSNTRCPGCGLFFDAGVWRHETRAKKHGQPEKLCPACLQIKGGQIGGIVQLRGAFAESHRQELLNRIRNVEKMTREERPLERIVEMKEDKEGIVVSATTEHLIARIGKSIQRDFGGVLNLRYAPEDKFVFAHWERE